MPRLLYGVFGSPGTTFLVHELSGIPDFHHVVQVKFKVERELLFREVEAP